MYDFSVEIVNILQPMFNRKSKFMENAYTYDKNMAANVNLPGLAGLVGPARPGELATKQTYAIAKKL